MKNIKLLNYFRKDSKTVPIFSLADAEQIAKELNVNFAKSKFDLRQFTMGLNVELEHGSKFDNTNVTKNDPLLTGKIALAHLQEFPDYYTRLKKLEEEATLYWQRRRKLFQK